LFTDPAQNFGGNKLIYKLTGFHFTVCLSRWCNA